jgi:hypothetical protein
MAASEALKIEREKRKCMVELARIQAGRDLAKDATLVLCDPLWSSVLGFVVVHEARKANLVGPVADDLLYAGIISINASRAGLVKEAAGVAESAMGTIGGKIDSLLKLLPAAVGLG